MIKKIVVIALVLILVLLAGFLFINNTSSGNNSATIFWKKIFNDEKADDENKKSSDNSGVGGGKNIEGYAVQEENTPEYSNCRMQQISYSLINFNETSNCNQYEGEICIDKTITCSIEIHNRDDEVRGIFELELLFVEEGGNRENPIERKTSEFFLEPLNYWIFEDSIDLQSSGEDGFANKEIDCFYNTLEVPEKEVCY